MSTDAGPPTIALATEQLEHLAALIATTTAPTLIDAAGAAAQLGVPATWVLAEARADRLPHVRLGRYVRFEPAALTAWAAQRRHGPTPNTTTTNPTGGTRQ